MSKLTIGLPFALLTTVGDGSLGLRSLSLMEVAARISSLRTSRASGVPGCVAGGSWSSSEWEVVRGSLFRRYECRPLLPQWILMEMVYRNVAALLRMEDSSQGVTRRLLYVSSAKRGD